MGKQQPEPALPAEPSSFLSHPHPNLTRPPSPWFNSSWSLFLHHLFLGHPSAISCHALIPKGRKQETKLLKTVALHCKERIPDHNNNASRGLGQIGRWKGKTHSGLRASGVFDLPVSLIMQAIVVLGARGRVPNPVEWMPAPWFLSHNYNPRFSFLRSHSPSLYSLSSLALWDWVPPARIAFKNGKNLSFWKP